MTSHLVPALATVRRLQGLAVHGHNLHAIAQELGVRTSRVHALHRQKHVDPDTEWLVEAVADKLRARPGQSTRRTRLAAQRQWWLPLQAWDYGDITDPHLLAEVTALLGWLHHGPDPMGPLIELARQAEALPLIALQIASRRAQGLFRTGNRHPAVLRLEQLRNAAAKSRRKRSHVHEGLAA